MSLLDSATPATPDTAAKAAPAVDGIAASITPPAPDAGAVVQSSDWYYDQDLKGSGDKPEWMKDKYKTVTDQAKAYSEIEKKLGAFKGAPDEYDLTLKDAPDIQFSKDDPMLKDFLDNAKKNGVSQEYVSELLGTYAHALTANIPDPKAEMEKLGASASQEIQILGQWMQSKVTPAEYEIFRRLTTTAESVRFFEKIRQISTQSDVAPPSASHVSRETEAQVRQLVSDPRYDTDSTFRDEVKRRMSAAMGVK